jgi:putative membrane protein
VVTPDRRAGEPARFRFSLAFGVLGGPLAWIAHLGGSFLVVPWICSGGWAGLLHVLTVVTGVVAASAAGLAASTYRRTGKAPALGAALVSGFFCFLILSEGLPVILGGDPCAAVPTLDDPIVLRSHGSSGAALAGFLPIHPHDGVVTGAWWGAWDPDIWILGGLFAVTTLYICGVRRLWGRAGRGRGLPVWRVASYLGGIAALVLALVSPIDVLSDALFSVHMTQHMLLMVVAAPLLVLGNPVLAYVWALPRSGRRALAERWRRARGLRVAWRGLAHPVTIFVLHVGALWIWHVPELYEAALESPAMHTAEHASFLLSAMLFWWALSEADGRGRWPGYGAAVLYVFGTALQSGALGALLMFSPVPLYPAHSEGTALWGIDLLVDQQVAGALMWVPAGLVYSGAMLVLFLAWLRRADRVASRR